MDVCEFRLSACFWFWHIKEWKGIFKAFVNSKDFESFIKSKREERLKDWSIKPLKAYREEELERMRLNFYGLDPSYHIARYYFVRRHLPFRTPPYLAIHRRLSFQSPPLWQLLSFAT